MAESAGLASRHILNHVARGVLLMHCASGLGSAMAQSTPSSTIYTCIDAQGRKLTSDRPIAACLDREQTLLNPSGTVKARLGPSLTAHERAEQEARRKQELEEAARLSEERRRDRALLSRYPHQTAHDKERADALVQIGLVRQAVVSRVAELQKQQAALALELEFYASNPSKTPPALRRQSDDITHSLSVQARFLSEQQAEVDRINARFDEELARLRQLWMQHGSTERRTR